MVEAISGFRDLGVVDGEPVYLFKKVQLLVLDLHKRFSESHSELFYFHDIGEMTVFADNVIPTMLHHLEIISLDNPNGTSRQIGILQGLQEDLKTGRDSTMERSLMFRAAAVDACETILQRAKEANLAPFITNMTAEQLGAYLWHVAKEGTTRQVIRFCDSNTIYF